MASDQVLDLKKIESKLVKLFTDKLEGKKFCEELYTKQQYPVFIGFFKQETVPDVEFTDQIPQGLFPDNAFGGREARLQFVNFLTNFETEIKQNSIAIYKKIAGSEQNSLFAVLRAQQAEREKLNQDQTNLQETTKRIQGLTTERDRLLALNHELEAKLQKLSLPNKLNFNWQQLLSSKQKKLTDSITALDQLKERVALIEAGLEEATTECTSLIAQLAISDNHCQKFQIENEMLTKQLDANANLYADYDQRFNNMVDRVKESEFHYIQLNQEKLNLEFELEAAQQRCQRIEQEFVDYRATVENLQTVWSKLNFELPLNPFFYLKGGLLLLILFFVLTIIRGLSSFFKTESKPRYYR